MKASTFRICAVCGKRHGATFGYRTTLRLLGIKGDKAVPECVRKALTVHQAEQDKRKFVYTC